MKLYYRDITTEKLKASEFVRKYKAKQEQEIEDRKRERNRLRGVRAGYQENHKVIRNTIISNDKEIEKLERDLNDRQRTLQKAQKELFDLELTIKEIVERLEGYWGSLPKPAEQLKTERQAEQRQLNVAIKLLEERQRTHLTKDNYYRKGRVKRVDGKEYHVLDRKDSWEYITANSDRVLAYYIDQANNLFAFPVLQQLNSHKVMQMRQNVKVEFVIDFSAELFENTQQLENIDLQLKQIFEEKVIFESILPEQFRQILLEVYTNSIVGAEEDISIIEAQLELRRTQKEQLEKNADDIFYEFIELDYLDDYEEEDRYY